MKTKEKLIMNKKYINIVILTIFFQVISLIRTSFFASLVGASKESDAYYLASVIAISLTSLVTAAISTVLVPQMSLLINDGKNNKKDLIVFSKIIIYLTFCFSFLLSSVVLVIPNNNLLFKVLFIILISTQVLRSIIAIFTAYFQVTNQVLYLKIASAISASSTLIIFLVPNMNIIKFTIILSISFLVEFCVLLWKLIVDLKIKKIMKEILNAKVSRGSIRNTDVKFMMINTKNILLSASAFQFSILVSNFIAQQIEIGAVSVYNYSSQLLSIITATVLSNLILIIYPKISLIIIKNKDLLIIKESLKKMIITGVFFFIFISSLTYFFGEFIISAYLVRGEFSREDAKTVYIISSILFIGLPFSFMRDISYRVFYSIGDTKFPSKNSLVSVTLNIILTISLVKFIGIYSLPLGPVLSTVFSSINSYRKLVKIGYLSNFTKDQLMFIASPIVITTILFYFSDLITDELTNSLYIYIVKLSFTVILSLIIGIFLLKKMHAIIREE